MGSNSSSPQGTVHVKTEKPFYYAGETVTGTIFLHLAKNYSGNTLVLKVKGKEETSYVVENGSGKARQSHSHSGKNIFYNHRIPIYVWNVGYVPAGQFAFPFAFTLNNFLPGTFEIDNHGYRGLIRYKLKAELESWNRKDKSTIKHSCPLIVREPIKSSVTALHGEMNANVKSWICLNQGSSFIRCYFERNAYAPGDTANIICEIDNTNCNLGIKTLNCALRSKISLRDNQGKPKEKVEEIIRREFSGVGPHQMAMGESRRLHSMQLIDQRTHTPFHASTNGQLIKCEYTLVVTSVLDGCVCCSTVPQIEVPITIYAPVPQFETVAPPPDWNPQSMPAMNFTLNDSYSYATKDNMQAHMSSNQISPDTSGHQGHYPQMANPNMGAGGLTSPLLNTTPKYAPPPSS